MEEFQYPPLKAEDIDKFVHQVQNKQIDSIEYLKILEGFIYQFDLDLQPPLDYIAQRDFDLILLLQNQLQDSQVLLEFKVVIINVLCNIFTISPFAAEYFCENGGINQLNQLCAQALSTEYDKTNFRRLSDIVLACIGTCLEYQPEQSLISLQSNKWIFDLFGIYQKPAQYRSLANYISLLITNSPSEQSRLIIPQISQIFVNLLNYYDTIIYAFILKTLKNIKDKDSLILMAKQNIIVYLTNYLLQVQILRPRDRSLILQFLFVLSNHSETIPYFVSASFSSEKLMKLTFINQTSNIVVPRNLHSHPINKKDDDSNSIVFLLGIVNNLIKDDFNQDFFHYINTITHLQIKNFSVVDSIITIVKSLLEYRHQQDALLIFNYLKQILLNDPQTKIYLESNPKFKQNILLIISQLAHFDPSNQEIIHWYNEISNISQFQQQNCEHIEDDDINNLADILANMDLTEVDHTIKKR